MILVGDGLKIQVLLNEFNDVEQKLQFARKYAARFAILDRGEESC